MAMGINMLIVEMDEYSIILLLVSLAMRFFPTIRVLVLV
jgi:hypothetical protein